MRIAVIGASAGTGREVVEQAVARGHQVVAVSRRGCDVDGAVTVPGLSLTTSWTTLVIERKPLR